MGAGLGLDEGSVDGVVVSLAAGEGEALASGEADGETLVAAGEFEAAGLVAGEPGAEVLADGAAVSPEGVVAAGDPDGAALALGADEGGVVTTGVAVGVGVGRGMKLGNDGRGVGKGSVGPGVSRLSQVYPACVADPK